MCIMHVLWLQTSVCVMEDYIIDSADKRYLKRCAWVVHVLCTYVHVYYVDRVARTRVRPILLDSGGSHGD